MRSGTRAVLVALVVCLVSYVVWGQAERRALTREIADLAARGEPVSAADLSDGADTPERLDAARIYAAAAARARALPQEITFRLGTVDVDSIVGPPLGLAELERIYRPDTPALQLLDQATPLDFNGFGDVEFDPQLSPLLTLNGLAALRADLLSARGRGDEAAAALVACARLWRTMPLFQQYQTSVRLLASIRILLRHTRPGDRPLAGLQRAVADLPDTDDLVRDLELRRARFIDEIERPYDSLSEAVLLRLLQPWIARSNRRNLANFHEALSIASRPWPEKFVLGSMAAEQYASTMRSPSRPGLFTRVTQGRIAPYGVGVVGLMVGPAGRELAARRIVVTALAIERYRRAHAEAPPPSLDTLVPGYLPRLPADPFSGLPLMYRASGGGYLLYSVDVDRKDDGGALYGLGSQSQLAPRQGAGRDLGLRVTP